MGGSLLGGGGVFVSQTLSGLVIFFYGRTKCPRPTQSSTKSPLPHSDFYKKCLKIIKNYLGFYDEPFFFQLFWWKFCQNSPIFFLPPLFFNFFEILFKKIMTFFFTPTFFQLFQPTFFNLRLNLHNYVWDFTLNFVFFASGLSMLRAFVKHIHPPPQKKKKVISSPLEKVPRGLTVASG